LIDANNIILTGLKSEHVLCGNKNEGANINPRS